MTQHPSCNFIPIRKSTLWFISASCATLLCTVGCTNSVDQTPNALPIAADSGLAGTPAGGTSAHTGGATVGGASAGHRAGGEGGDNMSCQTCPVSGSWYRFNTLAISSLDGDPDHNAIGVLNNLWNADIRGDQLNVLFEIKEVTPSQITVRALNAARYNEAGMGYCLLPETAIEFTFDRNGCDFINPEASGINIYAGSVDIPKNCSPELTAPNTIPVREVTLTGSFSPDCGQILRGRVPSASIPQSGLVQTCTCLSPIVENCVGLDPSFESEQCAGCNMLYSSLNEQLSLFGELSYDCQADEEAAVCLEAEFEAVRLDFTPSNCEL